MAIKTFLNIFISFQNIKMSTSLRLKKTDRINLTGYYNPGSDTNWAFNGDNIYNLNTGGVGVGKSSGINYSLDVCGNINCTNPYYTISGEVFNNNFYPALSYNNSINSTISTIRSSGLTQPSYNDIDWSPELGLFCMVGQQGLQGRIATSSDGITWTPRNNYGVFLVNTTNVSIPGCVNDGSENNILCSTTNNLVVGGAVGISSASSTSARITSITDISRFVTSSRITLASPTLLATNIFTCNDTSGLILGLAVSSTTTTPGTPSSRECIAIDSSTNFRLGGVNSPWSRGWNGNLCYADNAFNGVTWCRDLSGTGMFVATSGGQYIGRLIVTSSDGITWTRRTIPSDYTSTGKIAYSPKLRRVVVTGGSIGFLYSDNGIDWFSASNPVSTNSYGVIVWSPELEIFVSYSSNNSGTLNVVTSPDGINWTPRTAPPVSNNGLAWSSELGIFCCTNPNSFVVISSDGINWTRYNVSGVTLPQRRLVWCPQLRMFVGCNSNNIVSYSFDGINWLNRTATSGLKCVTYSPELGIFVVAGSGTDINTDNTIATSNFKTRPPTSYNFFDSSYNNINELGLWTIPRFGRGVPVIRTDTSFNVTPAMNWIICNTSADVSCNLPSPSLYPGEELMIKTVQARNINSTLSNVVSLDGRTVSTSILPNTAGKWATLVSDGTRWVIMRAN